MGINDALEQLNSCKEEYLKLERTYLKLSQLVEAAVAALRPVRSEQDQDALKAITEIHGLAGRFEFEITTPEAVARLPRGSVLLCNVAEVFWLPGITHHTPEDPRIWYAAGYGPDFTWTDKAVAEWGPLRILHIGAEN